MLPPARRSPPVRFILRPFLFFHGWSSSRQWCRKRIFFVCGMSSDCAKLWELIRLSAAHLFGNEVNSAAPTPQQIATFFAHGNGVALSACLGVVTSPPSGDATSTSDAGDGQVPPEIVAYATEAKRRRGDVEKARQFFKRKPRSPAPQPRQES